MRESCGEGVGIIISLYLSLSGVLGYDVFPGGGFIQEV